MGCYYSYDGQHTWRGTSAAISAQIIRCQSCGQVNVSKSIKERTSGLGYAVVEAAVRYGQTNGQDGQDG
jgi:hypothetical protein